MTNIRTTQYDVAAERDECAHQVANLRKAESIRRFYRRKQHRKKYDDVPDNASGLRFALNACANPRRSGSVLKPRPSSRRPTISAPNFATYHVMTRMTAAAIKLGTEARMTDSISVAGAEIGSIPSASSAAIRAGMITRR